MPGLPASARQVGNPDGLLLPFCHAAGRNMNILPKVRRCPSGKMRVLVRQDDRHHAVAQIMGRPVHICRIVPHFVVKIFQPQKEGLGSHDTLQA